MEGGSRAGKGAGPIVGKEVAFTVPIPQRCGVQYRYRTPTTYIHIEDLYR
jgi:hypothetical protein